MCLLHGHMDAALGHAWDVWEPPSMLCCNFICQGMTVYKEDAKCVFSGCSSNIATEALSPGFLQARFSPLNCLLLFLSTLLWLFLCSLVPVSSTPPPPSCRFTNPPKTLAGKNPPPVCVKRVPLFGWWHVPVFADGALAAWFCKPCHRLLQGSVEKSGGCTSPSPPLQYALAQPELF